MSQTVSLVAHFSFDFLALKCQTVLNFDYVLGLE